MPTSPTHLAPLDLTLVALYLVAITLFGLRFSKASSNKSKDKSLKSYFLANNTIPWWAIALSIVSAETSTLTIISIPGVAFAGDFGFLQVVLGYMIGRIVVAILFSPRYFRGEMLTAYQLIDQRFGPALHKLTAGLFLLTRAAAEGVRVFAISIVVGIAIGTGDTLSIAIISGLTLLYTFEGGMAAVIWTDVVQMALYVAGTLVAIFTLGAHVQGGWTHIHAVAAPLGKFHWLDFSLTLTRSYTFWAGILGGTFLTMASHGTDQLMVQRMLAARNLRESRLALLSSGAVIFLQFTLFLLIGVGLYVFYGQHPQAFTSSDRIFPTFIVHEMPHGVAGLLVAAILAAAMSNLSAALNSLASTTVIDFILPFRQRSQVTPRVPHDHRGNIAVIVGGVPSNAAPDDRAPFIAPHPMSGPTPTPQPNTTTISRIATVFWAIVLFAIAVYAIQHGGKGHVVETGLSIASVAYGCLLGVFLLGTLTSASSKYGATQPGAILGMICGLTLNLTLWQASLATPFLPMPYLPHIAFTWYVLIGSAVTFAVGLLASLILARPRLRTTTAILLLLCLLQASRYPEASASGLSPRPKKKGLQPPGQASPTYDFSEASTLITQAISQKKLPGAVLLIGHNGKVVFHQAYGQRKLQGEPGPQEELTPEPMTEDTLFDMASLTKVLVTTTAILQLSESGKLDLDAPVARYLPDFAQNNKQLITIRQLLTHYSGLPEDISLKDPWGLAAPDKPEGIRRAMASVPYGPPGVTFKYSDINFISLGILVETLSGEHLEDYARTHILVPLGMRTSGYHPFDRTCGPTLHTGSAIAPGPKPIGRIGMACPANTWSPLATIPDTAPTAHDNELNAQVNPDYDHLLRGTVHDPTTRRMGGVAGHAGLFSTAHDVSLFCQALLDKLIHNTGPFPLQQSTLQSALRPQAPATAHTDATIFTQDQTPIKGVAQRALGWDLNSAFSRPRGEIFPITTTTHPGSFGHTGFTGTSIWIDPTSNTYVILLANAIHPRGGLPISPLRGQVATAVAKALGLTAQPASSISYQLINPSTQSPQPRPPAPPQQAQSLQAQSSKLEVHAFPSQPHALSDSCLASHATNCPGLEVTSSDGLSEIPPLSLNSFTTTSPSDHAQAPGAPRLGSQARVHRVNYIPRAPSIAPYAMRGSTPTLPPTQTGIDVLEQTHYAALKSLAAAHRNHLRIALLTNQSGLDSAGRRTIDLLLHADPAIELKELFTPEHGLSGAQDTTTLKKEEDPTTHLPVISLYGAGAAARHPKQTDLKQLDAVVIDLQDAGVRFWTYSSVLGYFLEAAAKAHIEVIVLDRPNPVGGLAVQGPVSDPGAESYVNYMPTPVRHGMTFGELARFYNAYAKQVDLDPALLDARTVTIGTPTADEVPPATRPGLGAALTVVPMQNYTRAEFYSDTGVPWVPPSPNLRTPRAAMLYPAVGLVEQTNISVGRGTDAPFENLGALWIQSRQLADYLTARHIPGVAITPTTLTIAETPEKYPSHGQTIPAIHLEVTDPTLLDSPEFGVELLAALHTLYPKDFQLEKVSALLRHADTLSRLKAGQDPRDIAQTWQPALRTFQTRRAQVLLYR